MSKNYSATTKKRFVTASTPRVPPMIRAQMVARTVIDAPNFAALASLRRNQAATAGVATVILGAATVAVFDQALGWQGLLFSAPVIFLLGSGAALWAAEVSRPRSSRLEPSAL